eukprot:scaffold705_cov402-Prasinococcus_capsulatus_cf.AAC.29
MSEVGALSKTRLARSAGNRDDDATFTKAQQAGGASATGACPGMSRRGVEEEASYTIVLVQLTVVQRKQQLVRDRPACRQDGLPCS